MAGQTRNIEGMPICAVKCPTCPFGENGDSGLRAMVETRVMTEASQTCHSTGVAHGRPDTHICRGARDYQLMLFFRMGFISAPTDAAWAAKWAEVKSGTSRQK